MNDPQNMPATKDLKVGFYFYWKWQYQLRNDYLHNDNETEQAIDINSYLDIVDQDKSYVKKSEEIIRSWLNGDIRLDSLLTCVPRFYRSGYHFVESYYKDNVLSLSISIDTSNFDIKKIKKNITNELDGIFQLIEDEQNGDGIVPERILCIGHEHYWRGAALKEVKDLRLDFLARAVGLWIWDQKNKSPDKSPDKSISQLMDELADLFPDIVEIDEGKPDAWHLESKWYKRYYTTDKCIKKIEVINI
ncbi:hypothetical protein Dthio_PD3645 [Desulfonatronospira thiodismutans ASO3-1]|uniref:Uncharacterized protein n=1 Tax=Desulfonatronospira thiodismutans ASO3-1 TaxID=555779 RepID=D6SJY6_9BACT|nr:hypothetical protein [Desulfonatronospira thiodismutans]EFI36189.1 hypothetical protein Dthio_PD3645 [Desulfonatronospira thiodismutans ASO3-1]